MNMPLLFARLKDYEERIDKQQQAITSLVLQTMATAETNRMLLELNDERNERIEKLEQKMVDSSFNVLSLTSRLKKEQKNSQDWFETAQRLAAKLDKAEATIKSQNTIIDVGDAALADMFLLVDKLQREKDELQQGVRHFQRCCSETAEQLDVTRQHNLSLLNEIQAVRTELKQAESESWFTRLLKQARLIKG